MKDAYGSRNWELYGVKAHALKGAAKTLGLESLREVSEGLQRAAENTDIAYIENNHGKAVAMLEKLAECTEDF